MVHRRFLWFASIAFLSQASADPPRKAPAAHVDAGVPRDLAPALPARVTEDFADAWGHNKMQVQLLEHQRELVNAELARLADKHKKLAARGKAEFSADFDGADSFDDRTLEIKRQGGK